MSKILDKVLAVTANAALDAAVASAGCASRAGTYQSKEPAELSQYAENHSNENK